MNEYAPEYSKKERIILVLKLLAWAVPVYLVAQFWFFDWLSEYARHANCYQYGNINGVHLVFYGVFVFIPLSVAFLLVLFEGRRSIKIFKLAQNPLPNEKVLRRTRYRYGWTAKVQPLVILTMILFLIGLSLWGGYQAHDITSSIKPCTDARHSG